MTKQKKSFFEKLTGIRKLEDNDGEVLIDRGQASESSYVTQFQTQEDQYEFPEQTPPRQENFPPRERVAETPPPAASNFEQSIESEGQLTIDVYQTDDDIVIKSTIAGVKPEDLDVNINNDMVTVRGERKQDEEVDPDNYYYQECYWGPFSRSVILPVEIISDKAEATMKNGILTVRLPKADTTKSRKIQVRGY